MSNLQLIKSARFGEVTCDIYGGGDEFYMTREQIGTALEYVNPRESIKTIHTRNKARLDKFSRGVQIDTPSGKQTATLYTRKGIMEICRWSQQPKADLFMDWVWEVMDGLITGKTKLIPAKRSLGEINSAARIITKTLRDAGMAPPFIAVTVKNLYAPAGVEIPLEGIKAEKRLFEATEIADRLGLLSRSGKPHAQAVSAIIAQCDISSDEVELVPFQNIQSGHAGTAYQYAESVMEKVAAWLKAHGYPAEIIHNGKGYKVVYQQSA